MRPRAEYECGVESVGHYRSNLRDLEFNLFEVFGIQKRLGAGPFRLADEESVRAVLSQLNDLATGELAESFADGDREPPGFDRASSSVTVPERLKSAYERLRSGGWHRLSLPEELGGYGLPPTVQWAAAELLLGSNAPLYMYFSAVPNAAHILYRSGNERQRGWARLMVDRGWGATMVITEPDAGSDVGAARATATPAADGSWELHGVKRFITGGDHNLAENIMHLVLARPRIPGVATVPGTKGLSLFLAPKFLFDDRTGDLAERNGVFATNIEHKMGLRASATCELTFGEHGVPAKAWLLGDVHDGIAQMFQAIEWARMTVGTKAIGTLSTGYLNALAFARQRVQGPDMTRMTDRTAPRVTIVNHPDVRRQLMLQKAYAEGLRALYLYIGTFQDQVLAGEGDVALAERVNDLLLPVLKGVGSERAYELLAQSLQVFGGSGYLQDYPIEQYIRDSKIDSLYEGTTAIQSLDLFFRKIVRDNGAALTFVNAEVESFLVSEAQDGQLKEERGHLRQALEDVQGMGAALVGFLAGSMEDPRSIYKVGQNTVRFLMSVGDLLAGWLLLRQAETAFAALEAGRGSRPEEVAFYEGKIAAASFFARTVLPELSARRRIVESTSNALMDVDETVF